MVLCNHKSCEYEKRIWLPIQNRRGSDIALHPWCLKCGLVKNISDDRPHRSGYWTNVLSRITRSFSLTQCQKRLVAKELESHQCFNDIYGVTGSAQKELFVKIVRKYCYISRNYIDSFIC